MFLICWTEDGLQYWEMVDSELGFYSKISDLVESGIAEEDIVCGEKIYR
jgi:hypothetical protein